VLVVDEEPRKKFTTRRITEGRSVWLVVVPAAETFVTVTVPSLFVTTRTESPFGATTLPVALLVALDGTVVAAALVTLGVVVTELVVPTAAPVVVPAPRMGVAAETVLGTTTGLATAALEVPAIAA
jgi:hypothetical protein